MLLRVRCPFHGLGEELAEEFVFQIWVWFVLPSVAEHGDVDAAFAVIAHPIHGFALMGDLRNGVSQDGEFLSRAMLTMRKLFGRMHPLIWKAVGDGVFVV